MYMARKERIDRKVGFKGSLSLAFGVAGAGIGTAAGLGVMSFVGAGIGGTSGFAVG